MKKDLEWRVFGQRVGYMKMLIMKVIHIQSTKDTKGIN